MYGEQMTVVGLTVGNLSKNVARRFVRIALRIIMTIRKRCLRELSELH